MHPYRYTPGFASAKCLHRLLLTASLQSGVYEFYTLPAWVASKSSLCPKVEKFVNGVFAPPVLVKKFGVPAGPGGRALGVRRRLRLWRDSPSRSSRRLGHPVTIPHARKKTAASLTPRKRCGSAEFFP